MPATATSAPLRVLSLTDLGVDPSVLGARPGEAWLIRPDGYVSAVLADPSPESVGGPGLTVDSVGRDAIIQSALTTR